MPLDTIIDLLLHVLNDKQARSPPEGTSSSVLVSLSRRLAASRAALIRLGSAIEASACQALIGDLGLLSSEEDVRLACLQVFEIEIIPFIDKIRHWLQFQL